jgi:hypothetical protein
MPSVRVKVVRAQPGAPKTKIARANETVGLRNGAVPDLRISHCNRGISIPPWAVGPGEPTVLPGLRRGGGEGRVAGPRLGFSIGAETLGGHSGSAASRWVGKVPSRTPTLDPGGPVRSRFARARHLQSQMDQVVLLKGIVRLTGNDFPVEKMPTSESMPTVSEALRAF